MTEQGNTILEVTAETPISKYIQKLQVVEIEVRRGLFAGQYKSRVNAITDSSIKLEVPKIQGKQVFIWEKTHVHINYMRPDAMYTFRSQVIRSGNYPQPLLIIGIPDKVERIQRRRYVRVECKHEVFFRPFKENREGDEIDEPFYKGTMLNVSAGGMRLDNKLYMTEKGTILELKWEMDGIQYDNILGEVVRSLEIKKADDPSAPPTYSFGINFIQIHRVQKEKIMAYVLKRERELIASGQK